MVFLFPFLFQEALGPFRLHRDTVSVCVEAMQASLYEAQLYLAQHNFLVSFYKFAA